MQFVKVLNEVLGRFDSLGIRYALIGGFAMALRGVQRTTVDLDFILMLEDMDNAHEVLESLGYHREFHSENVSHYQSPDTAWGRIDLLHAFRGPTLGMLSRAEPIEISPEIKVKVVHVEDLIGLKIQALVNDPSRSVRDWSDIYMMLEETGKRRDVLDWELISDYLAIFDLQDKLSDLKSLYGATD